MAIVLRTRDGRLDAEDTAHLAILEAALQQPEPKLLLHLHGGLVNEANGMATASRLGGATPDGFGLGQEWQQVFVVWRTGALETVATNWIDLFENDRLYKALLRKLIEFAARKIILPVEAGRGAGASVRLTRAEIDARLARRPKGDPFADIGDLFPPDAAGQGRASLSPTQSEYDLAQEFQAELEQDNQFADAVVQLTSAIVPVAGRGGLVGTPDDERAAGEMLARLSAEIRGELGERVNGPGGRGVVSVTIAVLRHAASIILRIVRRMRAQRDHGFYATIVEELARELYGDLVGAAVWGMMKKDAADHFKDGHLGRQLLDVIPAGCRLVVTAHSAGSIWAAEMIKVIAALRLELRLDLVLLGPAARMDLFAEAIRNGGDAVARRRIYALSDSLERADAVLGHDKGYIYPSSLLYLVSGLFEEVGATPFPDAPLVGMQRFLSGNTPWLIEKDQVSAAKTVMDFFSPAADAIVYSKTEADAAVGMRTQADMHGGFDDEHETLASIASFFS
ncbi:hypothetical protein [Mesorhizobium sophorae]|uniref:hypothetical protein n=1 Tax=Mesorhizobium sophorae TaxID=1300294 RepID=UPI00117CEC5E|nr:hypothetical protein [Mesorhizobium sophorae]